MGLCHALFAPSPRRFFLILLLLVAIASALGQGSGSPSEFKEAGKNSFRGGRTDELRKLQTRNLVKKSLDSQNFQVSLSSGSGRKLLEDPEEGDVQNHGRGQDADRDGRSNSTLQHQFIYVYELDSKYNMDLVDGDVQDWDWAEQYKAEYEAFEMLAQKGVHRTLDPEAATLFYVPFFACRYVHVFMGLEHLPYPELQVGFNAASFQFTRLLQELRRNHPYFNRLNGRDHFSVLSHDHGRCSALTFTDPLLYGEMFFIQFNGDKMVQSNFAQTDRGMQVLNFNWGVGMVRTDIPAIPCYMADRDIVVPPVVRNVVLVPEGEGERPIQAVFRFSRLMSHGVAVPFWGHHVRTELYDLFAGVEGYDFGAKSEAESWEDWKHATFCAAPPGHSQWTARLFKIIFAGCIPVTFFEQHDNPWQDDIDYELFSVNIGVDELPTMKDRLDEILGDPARLKRMQHEVTKVQNLFLWGESGKVWKLLAKVLQRQALKLHAKKHRLKSVEESTTYS